MFLVPRSSTARPWIRIGFYSATLAVVLVGSVAAYELTVPMAGSATLVSFEVPVGASAREVGNTLAKQGLVRSAGWFSLWVRLTGRGSRFVAGNYRLPQNSTVVTLARLLTGAVAPTHEVNVRLIEGWTMAQMDSYLAQQSVFSQGAFQRAATDSASVTSALANRDTTLFSLPRGASLEGYLSPDTYRLYRTATPADLIAKMLNEFEYTIIPLTPVITKQHHTVREIVILASIVEREVASDKDRAMVADIFWRRLAAGRGLEADSTVNYITGKGSPSLSAADLKLDSPYNTYRNRGLPPGPISNPSRSSLLAVVHPAANSYEYFLTTPSGAVVYSTTYQEHLAAKQKYLK